MAEQSFLAKIGLRLGVVGSSAALAIAAPSADANYSAAAGTAANRTGFYFDQTAAAEKIGVVAGGVTGPKFQVVGGGVQLALSAGLAYNRTTFSNAPVVLTGAQCYVGQVGIMSAARVVTLPAAASVPAGSTYIFADESGTVTNTNTITITAAGGDTINGSPTLGITTAYGTTAIVSDGVSKWTVAGGGTSGGGGGGGNLTGPITSVGLATSIAAQTGTGTTFVVQTSPTLITPNLGTPSAGVLTNCTGTAAGLTAGSVTTNANLTGPITSTGNATAVAAQTGTGSVFVMQASPTLTTPNLGTPSAAVLTNATGTAAGLTAGNVTTNANLTGPITSAGNATSVAAQTGTGSVFVMQASPTLTTPNIGAATGASVTVTGQFTSTLAIGTAPFVVTSTTVVPNLYVARAQVADSATSVGSALDGTFSVNNTADPTKQFKWSLGGMTASAILTLASTQSTSQTLSVPNITGSDTVATLGVANAFTAAMSITQASISAAATTLNIQTTWNNSGVTFAGLVFNVTDTASTIGSTIFDFQRNAGSVLNLTRSGTLTMAGNFNIPAGTVTAGGVNQSNTNTATSGGLTAFVNFTETVNPAGASTAILAGCVSTAQSFSGCAQNLTDATAGLRGIQAQATHNGTGTVTALAGLVTLVSTTGASGTITSAIGYRGLNGSKSAGTTITTLYGIYMDSQTAGSTNYAIFTNAGLVTHGDTLTLNTVSSNLVITQGVATTGSPTSVLVTAAAHTTLTAGAEAIDINFNLARTVQFATGAITTQRAHVVQAPTYGFVGASTITTAATFAITGAPVLGTNATFTNSYALWVQSGSARIDQGTVTVSTPILNLTQTWNAGAVVFTGAIINITNTASQTTSIIQDWQIASASVAKIDRGGVLTATGLTISGSSTLSGATAISVSSAANSGTATGTTLKITANPSADTSGIYRNFSGSFSQTTAWNYTDPTGGLVGLLAEGRHQGTGTVTRAIGLQTDCVTTNSSGTITNAIGVSCLDATKAGGTTITNLYGLKVENQTQGGTNYAIFTGTGLTVLGDSTAATGANTGAFQSAGGGSFVKSVYAPGLMLGIATKTGTYGMADDDFTILADTSGGGFTVTLPAAPQTGRIYNIKKIAAANTLTIGRNAKNIDGAASDLSITSNNQNTQLQYSSTFGWAVL